MTPVEFLDLHVPVGELQLETNEALCLAEWWGASALSLPLFPQLDDSALRSVFDAVSACTR